jgi:hypothetical protein
MKERYHYFQEAFLPGEDTPVLLEITEFDRISDVFFSHFQLDRPDTVIISSTMPMVLPTIEADTSCGRRRRLVRRQAQTTNLTSDQNLQFEKHQFDRMVNSTEKKNTFYIL